MKAKGVYPVSTRMALYWVMQQVDTYLPAIAAEGARQLGRPRAMFKAALRIGVPIALGTDAGSSRTA